MKRLFGLVLVCSAMFAFPGCDSGGVEPSENAVMTPEEQSKIDAYDTAQSPGN